MTAITASPLLTAFEATSPLLAQEVDISTGRTGLIIVDEVHGFCTVGRGPLAPAVPNAQVATMIDETAALARRIGPKLVFRDSHEPGQDEKPYPPHCVVGTGDDMLVDELAWLENDPDTTVMRKDCIDGVIAGFRPDGSNAVFDWIRRHNLVRVVFVGICTDICVLNPVCSLLSARNRGLLGALDQIVVYEPGCATYDLPLEVALELGLPASAAHPQDLFHRMGLAIMQNQGAIVASVLL
ncbi:isochorismatase family protein [Bosea sp. RAC05]|uniref:isochorismatase family protein n=1 Tax=Bosea sp. RAC05 TaxID=1842539 RepID=UPI00083DBD10|nr:isochorismatase family protein [Bosea sp. RAC05]AOG03205.1 isochorismatase family protein [Bosea sp. RAC05]